MKGIQILMMNNSGGNGYLYNANAYTHVDFAASGWHVPTNTELNTLITYIGGYTYGGTLKDVGVNHWNYPNTGANNSSKFTLYGSGGRVGGSSSFAYIRVSAYIVSTTSPTDPDDSPLFCLLYNNSSEILMSASSSNGWVDGYSVRLIKDSTTLSDGEQSTMTDLDGNLYTTICIGTQEWTVQNWKCTQLNDGTSITKVTNSTTWGSAYYNYPTRMYYCAYDNNDSYV